MSRGRRGRIGASPRRAPAGSGGRLSQGSCRRCGNADALNLLGAIAHQLGRHREAVDCIRRAIEIHEAATPARPPNAHAYSNLGEAYRALGESADARACYERALAIRPDYAEAHYHLGLVLADEGRHEDAIACYRKAIALKPELLLAQYNLGLALKAEATSTKRPRACARSCGSIPDNELAKFSLAALTAQNPARPPERYVANLFDHHARDSTRIWSRRCGIGFRKTSSTLPAGMREPPRSGWDVLDLGCGTGLVGAAIAPFARHLVGVDLSQPMLEMARARNLYQRLEQRGPGWR